MALPNDETLAAIDAALARANVTNPGARAEMIRAYDGGKFVADSLNSYVVLVADELAKGGKPPNGEQPGTAERADDAAFIAQTGIKPSTNPWSAGYRGKAPAEGERIRLIRTLGTKVASEMARSAGTDIAGRKLRDTAA